MINKKDFTIIIWDAINDRLNEALTKKNWNDAYALAFSVGMQADIKDALKPIIKQVSKQVRQKALKDSDKLATRVHNSIRTNLLHKRKGIYNSPTARLGIIATFLKEFKEKIKELSKK